MDVTDGEFMVNGQIEDQLAPHCERHRRIANPVGIVA
jgi:hypothetical protein